MDPRKCVILVPFSGFIHQECEDALKELERRGYQVRRVGGYAAIDQGRNQMATDALRDGFEETPFATGRGSAATGSWPTRRSMGAGGVPARPCLGGAATGDRTTAATQRGSGCV
jgi:hypothetical protein